MSDDHGRYYESPLVLTLKSVGAALLLLAVIVGIYVAVSAFVRSERTERVNVEPGSVGNIRIESTIANVVLKPAKGDEIEFSATIVDGLSDTFYQLGRRGADTYVLDANCREWVAPGCGVTVTVGVPKGYPVLVETTSGDVAVQDLDGVVTVSTTTGDIKAEGAKLVDMTVKSVDGSVDVDFATPPGGFKVKTTSGDIKARLPRAGAPTYTVAVGTTSGQVETDIESSANPTGFITIESASGDVSLKWAG